MPEMLSAVYEGDGVLRLEHGLSDVERQSRLNVFVLPAQSDNTFAVEKIDPNALRRQIRQFEKRYALNSADFMERFQRGEIGDDRDFVVWAGLQELLQRMSG